ncbi:MAG: glutamate-5-semialdehyde dehydrogenase [Thermomonas sp.]|uniref:glutamate-5-semialdehyde dehydrogenase n=1 Tax=Thermomonas sp. TaxID=1971895 RepID=UPI001B42A276|nr:glutamate-5-semialdehyde dehydrogenase [Thermomonas sp.]MBK6924422.1 glutamate-5-semialdehyde dehydrogenase [Thermomonas sp.]MBP8615704.1 glutamate-5-semialdehyde dehydrogenase [Thermomonas sp.]MBP8648420.1 glutamate-5-semialdehyde dehydrogenase [Thermomonas sp.]HQX93050.1 glutamate-5-semialdehyde dehydrogenase [Thermomonas sp.]HQY81539.1 glutamate-5-semialdehyde dehydrogenase [Thermomonas sp.]
MSGYVRQLALAARAAQAAVAACDAATRRALIVAMAAQLEARLDVVLRANADDLRRAATAGAGKAVLDRLLLDAGRVRGMAAALREVAAQPDPLGAITRSERRPNGIMVERQRIPLGLVAMIYEARPNVTAEAAALCLKAGNAVLLRGGSEAAASNAAIAACLHAALRDVGMPEAAVSLVADTAREHVLELLQLTDLVDLAIPRGGESLIRFVAEHARVPVIKHYKGVCHLYVDRAADIGTAIGLLIDGKVSRPGVCNALETLLVHRDIAEEFLPPALAALRAHAVEVRGDARTRAIDAGVLPATEADYAAEFLDLVIAVRVVDSLDQAIAHIRQYGSDHTEVIATADPVAADAFVRAIRSSAVMVNASSRFNDGGQLGLGAEIGISTTRLHAYGPMGAESLTIERFVVRGEGQLRQPPAAT